MGLVVQQYFLNQCALRIARAANGQISRGIALSTPDFVEAAGDTERAMCYWNESIMNRIIAICLVAGMLGFPQIAFAAPSISSLSGDTTHGGRLTIDGSQFGNKGQAAPVIWDSCESSGLSSQWDGAWPSESGEHNLKCRTSIRGISLPHNRSGMYLAGSHADDNGPRAGWNVIMYKTRTVTSYPAYTYASWYARADDNWQFCGDNNYKTYVWGEGTTPYDGSYYYLEYNDTFESRNSTKGLWHHNYLWSPDNNGHNAWWDRAVNPHSGVWSKIEQEIRHARDGNGYVKLWENGVLKMDYSGRTDFGSGSQRTEGIGGYGRCSGSSRNYRYFADVYLDYSRARVVIANSPNLATATVIENQIPASWSSSRIEVEVNLGAHNGQDNLYLFVFDTNGKPNASGFPVDLNTVVPNPPTNLTAD